MKKKSLLSLLSCALMLSLLFASCGASSIGSYTAKDEAAPAAEMEDSYSYYNTSEESGTYYRDEDKVTERMLVYDIDYTLETKEFEETCDKIEAKATELGGYISSYNANTGSYATISYSFRIPSAKLDDFTSLIESLGTVTRKNTEVQDYTNTYYDYQTEISLLETEEEYVQKYLESATDSYERADLIDQLLSIRREIARLERASKNIVETVTYSTVDVYVHEVKVYTDIKITYGDTLRSAFRDGWADFADFCRDLLYGLVSISPVIVILLVIFLAIFIPVKVKKNRKKKEQLAIAKAQAERLAKLQAEEAAKEEPKNE